MDEKLVKTKRGYELYVRTTKGREPAIVFVHGLGCNCTQWVEQQEHFEKKGVKTISMDLLGTGNSERPEGAEAYSIQNLAKDVEDIVTDVKHVVIVAHSMGGIVSLALHKLIPKKIRGIVLIEPVYKNPLEQGRLTSKAMEPLVKHLASFFEKHIKTHKVCTEINLPDAKESHLKMLVATLLSQPLGIQLECIKAMMKYDITDHLSKIDVPVMVVGGGKDVLVHEGSLKQLIKKIKKSSFLEVENADHALVIMYPEKINEIVDKFYKEL